MQHRKTGETMGRNLSKQLMRRFFFHMLIYACVILLILLTGYIWCKSRVWYPSLEYYILNGVEDNLVSVILILFLIGCVIIACVHFAKIAKMMETMVEAVDDMYTERVRFISLPPLFQEVENKLNLILGDIRESREAARAAEQRKNDMLVYMAHDLKTPLTSVLGYITLLKEEQNISEELRRKYLSIAWNKANRLESLINDFFEVTRMNLSSMSLEYGDVNMSRMMEQIFYEFRPMFQEKGLDYELNLEEDVILSCDVEKMERVLDNLIKNAINYSYPNTKIHVTQSRKEENGIQAIIRNKGKTIPKEKQTQLFEQFFRMDSARSSGTGGTGLGLAIAKQIIELHGGRIRCESENEEIAFIFTI